MSVGECKCTVLTSVLNIKTEVEWDEKHVVFKYFYACQIESGASKLREKLHSTASCCLLRNDVFGYCVSPVAELQQMHSM